MELETVLVQKFPGSPLGWEIKKGRQKGKVISVEPASPRTDPDGHPIEMEVITIEWESQAPDTEP
jgi:hypothetical protein